jgi:hypothetical protein
VHIIDGVSDTSSVEKGIDTVPEGNTIRIEWESSSDENVDVYEIYRNSETEKGKFDKKKFDIIAPVSVPDTFYEDQNLLLNVGYYYYILAVTDYGSRSEPSDTLNYKLIEKPINLRPDGSVSDTKPEFSWTDPNNAHYYVIRIMENDKMVWLSQLQSDYSERQTIRFNEDHLAAYDSLAKGVTYNWRVDVIGSESHSGSESQWKSIVVE